MTRAAGVRRAWLLVCVLIALVVHSAAVGAATPAPGPTSTSATDRIGLRLLDVPAGSANDPRAQIYIVDRLAPGTTIRRRVEISNSGAVVANVGLYSSAATIEHGSFLGAAGHTQNDLSSWTSVNPGRLAVSPGANATAAVEIAVPADAAPGEQYGVVWAEMRTAPSASGVTQVSRVGIRLYVSVGPGGAPAANFSITSLTAQRSRDGRPVVLATVHNTGGRALDLSGTLQLLAGPGGLSAGPFPASLGTTLGIDDTEPVTIVLDKQVPAGPWDAHITLHSGLVEERASATITFPDAGSASPALAESARASSPDGVVAGIAGLLALFATFLGVTLWRRRGRSRDHQDPANAANRTEPLVEV